MNLLAPTIKARALECVIALIVVVAGWLLLLKPAERSLAEDRARLDSVRAQVEDATVLTSSVGAIEAEADRTAATLKSLQAAQQFAAVSSRLYDAVNRLAASHHVKVLRLDPAGLRQVLTPATQAVHTPARGEVQEYRITVQGSYEAVANFIHACEHALGTSAVTHFRISPIPDSPRGEVEATVETVHLRILAAETGGGR